MRCTSTPGLLVSVRSAEEAVAALEGGADLIDVKEPDRGSLGRADPQVIRAVVEAIAGQRPVSAALGELVDYQTSAVVPTLDVPTGLAFVKWGLAGCGRHEGTFWRNFLEKELVVAGPPQTVVVAYADWQCAQAPPVADLVDFACQRPGSVFLLDTHCKNPGTLHRDRRPTLLDWLALGLVADLCRRCRASGVRVALAGSLGLAEIEALLDKTRPDWFAVRGAACGGAERRGNVEAAKVKALVRLIENYER